MSEIRRCINIAKSDTADNLLIESRRDGLGRIRANRIWVGGSGTVVVLTDENDNITLAGTIAGRWHKLPQGAKRIMDASTATSMIGGYER